MQISEAESAVMEALWERQPLAAEDVVAALAQSRHWQEATVKTLLNRLLKKGALSAEQEGRRYRYRPQMAREDYVLTESRGLLDRLFDTQRRDTEQDVAQYVARRGKLTDSMEREIADRFITGSWGSRYY